MAYFASSSAFVAASCFPPLAAVARLLSGVNEDDEGSSADVLSLAIADEMDSMLRVDKSVSTSSKEEGPGSLPEPRLLASPYTKVTSNGTVNNCGLIHFKTHYLELDMLSLVDVCIFHKKISM